MPGWEDALLAAEREMWDEIVQNNVVDSEAVAESMISDGDSSAAAAEVLDGTVACDGCNGSGIYYGRGYVENGVFKGFTGTCFRCGGKGRQTKSDVARNRTYDRHRRISV